MWKARSFTLVAFWCILMHFFVAETCFTHSLGMSWMSWLCEAEDLPRISRGFKGLVQLTVNEDVHREQVKRAMYMVYYIYKCIYVICVLHCIAMYCIVLSQLCHLMSSVDFYCLLYYPLPTVFLLYSSFICVSFSIACSVAEDSVWSFYCFVGSQEWLAKCISRKPKRLQKCQEIRKVPNVKKIPNFYEFLLEQWLVWTNLLVWSIVEPHYKGSHRILMAGFFLQLAPQFSKLCMVSLRLQHSCQLYTDEIWAQDSVHYWSHIVEHLLRTRLQSTMFQISLNSCSSSLPDSKADVEAQDSQRTYWEETWQKWDWRQTTSTAV